VILTGIQPGVRRVLDRADAARGTGRLLLARGATDALQARARARSLSLAFLSSPP
jgi:hypothetical protein